MLHTVRYPRASVILLLCTNASVVVASAGHSIPQLIERPELCVQVWKTDWFYGVGSYPAPPPLPQRHPGGYSFTHEPKVTLLLAHLGHKATVNVSRDRRARG